MARRRIKTVIIWLAIRDLMPASLASWLIRRLGLREA